ncbi:MAG: hypothetical protein ABR909_09355 [Candidatus Bathyarchaeia archaeon]|jgi:hypothetical protein
MFDLEELQSRLISFPEEYVSNFNYVWKRKIEIESSGNASVLDDSHRDEIYRRLCSILPKWQTYRPMDNTPCLATLKNSLVNISEAYNQLRKHTLLDFENIPNEALESVWHELGKAKENGGEMNDYGSYSVISICKPLLLIWGQTLAFDSKVRKNMLQKYRIDKYSGNWNLREWKNIMILLSRELNEDKNAIEFMKKKTVEWYGKNTPVPYGRFLDIYYFEGA